MCIRDRDREGEGFKYLTELFPRLSEAKIKEVIFTGPDIRKVICDPEFEKKISQKELAAWKEFEMCIRDRIYCASDMCPL